MPFPVANRVLYRKNPLELVVCQLRFPPILRIDAELPVAFQDKVRQHYPDFVESAEIRIEMPQGLGDQVPPEILRQVIQSSGIKNYEFSSGDGNWKINLTRTFIALSTKRYTRWEDFREQLEHLIGALAEIYEPSYFTRIGLRYVNKIRRSALGLDGVSWRELLSSNLIGMLNSPEVAESIESLEIVQGIRLAEGGGNARIASTLSIDGGPPEQVFTIDGDFFNAIRTEFPATLEKLNFLNLRSSRLIRWAITARLHDAMEPEPL